MFMKRLYDFNTWEKINESENSSLSSIFSGMAKSVSMGISALVSKFTEMFDEKPQRISLIFPLKGWEVKAVNLLKELGVVTGVFRSAEEAIQVIKALKNKGVKAKELVIGSHGDGNTLLMTRKDSFTAKAYVPELLKNAKEIITKDCTVFFTACHGADYLVNLVNSANSLGVGVYGSRGLYNYIVNTSENGYYYCKPYQIPKPKKVAEPRDKFYPGNLEIVEQGHSSGKDSIRSYFYGSFGKAPKLKIEFNPASFSDLGWQLKSKEALSFILDKRNISSDEQEYGAKDTKEIYRYSFYLNAYDFNYETSLNEIGFTALSNLLKDGKVKWPREKQKNFGVELKKSIEKGNVKLTIDNIDLVKERPKIKGYRIDEVTFDNNEHLMECGACKKVNKAPISWINPASLR